MKTLLYPCLWFNDNAKAAADLYCSVFPNSALLQDTPMVTTFELNGTHFMGLNGGPKYNVNSAISYYVYCGSASEIDRIYNALVENGQVIMPLDVYAWSSKYAWIIDAYGVNWQLDIDDINSTQKIVPTLLFANTKYLLVKEAMTHYTTIFNPSKILLEAPYPPEAEVPEGSLLFTQFKLQDFIFNATSSTLQHDFDFTPGNSFVVLCENQEEIDYYWVKLSEGGHEDMCGWLTDKYGVSWQIVPAILPQLMADPEKGQRVIQAFLKMRKFDIATLLNA